MKNKLIIISGPSGAGEDSVIRGLINKGLAIERVITTVTRPMREGESQGNPYYFISIPEFKKMIKAGTFVEWARVYDDYRGCTFEELERVKKSNRIGIWKIDYQGVKTAKKRIKGVVSIYIKPPSLETSIERIKKRKLDSEHEIKRRIAFVRDWLRPGNDEVYDYILINKEGKLGETIEGALKIIKQEIG
jgi:guanylate kinase